MWDQCSTPAVVAYVYMINHNKLLLQLAGGRLLSQQPGGVEDTYILHELLADGTDVLGEGGGEHHHLLLVGRVPEDLLHVAPHI